MTVGNDVMCATQHSIVDWVYSKIQILLVTLKTENQHRVERMPVEFGSGGLRLVRRVSGEWWRKGLTRKKGREKSELMKGGQKTGGGGPARVPNLRVCEHSGLEGGTHGSSGIFSRDLHHCRFLRSDYLHVYVQRH